jgi:hypothetical protein
MGQQSVRRLLRPRWPRRHPDPQPAGAFFLFTASPGSVDDANPLLNDFAQAARQFVAKNKSLRLPAQPTHRERSSA